LTVDLLAPTIASLSDLHATVRGSFRASHAVFHSHLSSYFIAPIGATVWRATTKTALTRQQRTRAICRVLIKSRKMRRCDSILPQRLRTLTAR
jgi:hypothetical protein